MAEMFQKKCSVHLLPGGKIPREVIKTQRRSVTIFQLHTDHEAARGNEQKSLWYVGSLRLQKYYFIIPLDIKSNFNYQMQSV